MEIYLSHSHTFDFKNDIYIPLRGSKLNGRYNFILPFEPGNNPYESEAAVMKKSDLIVAEVSYESTRVGKILGWAEISNKIIIVLHKKILKPSAHLKDITTNIISYSNADEMICGLTQKLDNLTAIL